MQTIVTTFFRLFILFGTQTKGKCQFWSKKNYLGENWPMVIVLTEITKNSLEKWAMLTQKQGSAMQFFSIY